MSLWSPWVRRQTFGLVLVLVGSLVGVLVWVWVCVYELFCFVIELP